MGSKLGRGFRTPANQAVGIINDGSYYFAAFEDNTLIYRNGELALTLSTKQTRNTVSLTRGDLITSNKPISMSRSGVGLQGLFYAWPGKRFAFYQPRYTVNTYMRAVSRTATVNIYRSDDLTTPVYADVEVTSNAVVDKLTSTTGRVWIIESDEDIVVYRGDLTSADCMPMYPASYEIYGGSSNSGRVSFLEDSTTVTYYRSDGTTGTFSGNRGSNSSIGGTGTQYTGSVYKLVSNKPICAWSYADSDGGEMTPYAPTEAFGKRFIIPEDEREWVKLISNKPATATFYAADGSTLGTRTLSGSDTYDIYECYATGTYAYENVLIETDEPVYGLVEGDGDDEQVLMADVFHDAADYGEGDGFSVGRKVVTEGLAFMVDASNKKSLSSGTQWKDRSGNKNHGTLVNGVTKTNNRKMSFDGSNDYTSFSVTKTAECTFAAWAKSNETSIGALGDMLFNAGSSGNGPNLYFAASKIIWNTWDSANNPFCTIPSLVVDGKFHYYVVVCDASAEEATLYIDGEEYGTADHTSARHQARLTANTNLYIGGNAGSYIWKGEIADFKMYNKKLSTSDIFRNYKQKKRKVQGR